MGGRRSNFVKGIRYNTERQSDIASAQKFTEKVLPYVEKVDRFVKKEIEENGKNPLQAIEEVMQRNSLKMIYRELNDEAVYKRVRKILLTKYLNKKVKDNEGR